MHVARMGEVMNASNLVGKSEDKYLVAIHRHTGLFDNCSTTLAVTQVI
jgi:hypothetical protein